MRTPTFVRTLGAVPLALALAVAAGPVAVAQSPLAIETARITIAGTSNVHDYTASTTTARVTRMQIGARAAAGGTFWDEVQKPGGLEAFEIAIAATTLKSDKEGLDKNMYKALKASTHPDITFRLARMEGAPGALTAIGTLGIAGVEREISFPVTTARKDSGLAVSGQTQVLMTDFGIAPPKAMLGMIKADPKITITFEVRLSLAST